jgi:tetratricopeptide (TPR) repeat protein
VWRIPPLSLRPGPDGAPGEAVRLLVDRATAARGGRPVEQPEMVPMRQLAERLDGLPLALELAAARLRVLSAAELTARLDDALATPSTLDSTGPGRHATMHAAVTWSYRTLPTRAAQLMRWLSVFAGRVDLGTVEWLVPDDALGTLSVLVDKSLVQAEITPSGTTYRMLDPIRGYAARRLVEVGEEADARDRHAIWARHAVADAHPMKALDLLADEVRAALRWTTTDGSGRDGLRIAAGLDQWWSERGLAREGRDWLVRLYARIEATGEKVPDAELATAYHLHAQQCCADGEYPEALRYVEQAESAAHRAGDPGLLARVGVARAGYLRGAGRLAEAEQLCREIITSVPRDGAALDAVYALAELLWYRGAFDEAAELLAAARPRENNRPAERGRRTVDLLLGLIALGRGDLVAGHEHLAVALRNRVGHGYQTGAREALRAFAVRCALAGDHVLAARLFGAAGRTSGLTMAYWTTWQTRVRGELGDHAFDAAYAEGGALSLDQASAAALAVEHPDMAPDSLRFSDAS